MVTLRKMTEKEFDDYLAYAVEHYAEDNVRSGFWKEKEALGNAKKQYAELLPEGLDSTDSHLFTATESGEAVGMIWLKQEAPDSGFIYDVYIWDRHRGKGYGRQTMQLIEEEGRQLGMEKIGLHVFGHNHAARALYEKLNYGTTNVIMEKKL